MPQFACCCCDRTGDGTKFVNCSICKKHFYYTCVDLSAAEVKTLKSKTFLKFTCETCNEIGDSLNELKAVIIALQNELQDLKSTIKQQEAPSNSQFDYEDIIHEISERNLRKRNIIVYGMSENPDLSKEEQNRQDKEAINGLVQFLSPDNGNISNEIRVVARLGKFDAARERPRPVKITLDDERFVHSIIRKTFKLKTNAQYSGISVSYDRTPRQIQHYKKLKAEMNERIAKGEVNLKIKYVQGVQRIVVEN